VKQAESNSDTPPEPEQTLRLFFNSIPIGDPMNSHKQFRSITDLVKAKRRQFLHGGATLTIMLALAVLGNPGAAFAQASQNLDSENQDAAQSKAASETPEGSWLYTVTIPNPPGAPIVFVGTETYAAGGGYPIFVREETDITELKTEKGLPLGLMNSEYSEIGLTLQAGDRVLMYTDGAAEAANSGGEEYGTSRLVKSLQKPSATARSVLAEVQEFAGGGTLSDDATAIVLRRE
jgi:hypothetical protein